MKDKDETLDIFKEVSLLKVRLQMDSISELKNRAGILLGFTIAFLGFILSNEHIMEVTNLSFFNKIPVYLILFSAFLFLLGLVVKNYSFSPKPNLFYEQLKEKTKKNIMEHLIKDLIDDFKDNDKEIIGLKKIINTGIFVEIIAIIWLVKLFIPII